MKTFDKVAAQGEIYITRLDRAASILPMGYKPLAPENGYLIVGHSETGHHHVIEAERATVGVKEKVPEGMRILYAIVREPTKLDHLRPFDTHKSIELAPGAYEIRIGREFDPFEELIRSQAD